MASRPYNSREIIRSLEGELLEDLGTTAFAILRNLIFASPVGNPTLWQNPDGAPPGYVGGHFRRNWLVSIGGPNPTETEGVDPTGGPTLAQGKNEIDTIRRRRTTRGIRLFFQNNVPYANRLAGGWSTQAPPGWVDEAIDAGLRLPGGRKVLQ